MNYREIGSEFHKCEPETGNGFPFPVEGLLVFSGRTAIETVLKEIPNAKKAVLPSYCCDSMIDPFIRAGIEVSFYPVNYSNGIKIELIIPDDADVFLWCNYFGYRITMPDMITFKRRGGIIIEDITHSLLSSSVYDVQSDYLVASVRKWEPISCGGYCASVKGKLHYPPTILPPDSYMQLKNNAMKLKAEYLEHLEEDKKQEYMAMFSDGNRWLNKNYTNMCIDSLSMCFLEHVDIEEQKKVRRENAHILYEGLKNKVEFLFPEENMDCPLFVPIISTNRDNIQKKMIQNQIYCPIHWPKPNNCVSNLFNLELSLVCDQRYTEKDMNRIVSAINL